MSQIRGYLPTSLLWWLEPQILSFSSAVITSICQDNIDYVVTNNLQISVDWNKQTNKRHMFCSHNMSNKRYRGLCSAVALPTLLDTAEGQPLPDMMVNETLPLKGLTQAMKLGRWYSSLPRTWPHSTTEILQVQFYHVAGRFGKQ